MEEIRRDISEKFRKDEYSAIVSSQVLDEGMDVPDTDAYPNLKPKKERRTVILKNIPLLFNTGNDL